MDLVQIKEITRWKAYYKKPSSLAVPIKMTKIKKNMNIIKISNKKRNTIKNRDSQTNIQSIISCKKLKMRQWSTAKKKKWIELSKLTRWAMKNKILWPIWTKKSSMKNRSKLRKSRSQGLRLEGLKLTCF